MSTFVLPDNFLPTFRTTYIVDGNHFTVAVQNVGTGHGESPLMHDLTRWIYALYMDQDVEGKTEVVTVKAGKFDADDRPDHEVCDLLAKFYGDGPEVKAGRPIDFSTDKAEPMNVKQCTRIAFPFECVQVTLENVEEVATWANGTVEQRPTRMMGTMVNLPVIKLNSRDYTDKNALFYEAALGCWIVKNKDSFRAYKPARFEAQFTLVEEEPVDPFREIGILASGTDSSTDCAV